MNNSADLHIHTFYSDSTSSPQEVVEQAHACGLSCIAITDHDTIAGVNPTMEAAEKYGLEIIAGVELSSEINGKDVHILGYLFDHENQHLIDQLKDMQDARVKRMEKMIKKLEALGVDNIAMEEVCCLANTISVGRPHLASVLMKKGWVSNIKMAFDKYLAEGAPAYVAKFKQTPQEAIELIRSAGGIAVLAHPMVTAVDELIPGFVQAGLGGLEVFYPNCANNVVNFYERLAQKHHLAVTGGSDAHGNTKRHTFVGKVKIPYELVEKLKQAVNCL